MVARPVARRLQDGAVPSPIAVDPLTGPFRKTRPADCVCYVSLD